MSSTGAEPVSAEVLASAVARGHEHVVEGLWRAAREDRLAHALGFFGPPGVGKFRAAMHFAMGLLCKREGAAAEELPGAPCGRCGPCRRFARGAHPDVFVLDPVERGLETLKISHLIERDQSEGPTLESFLRLRAAEGGRRVAVLRDFDRSVEEGQNALLKTLEEPGRGVCLIIESSAPEALLDTVMSRLVDVPFERLAPSVAQEVLVANGLDEREAAAWARRSRGAPGRALELRERGAGELRELVAATTLPRDAGGVSAHAALAVWSELAPLQSGDTPARKARAAARLTLEVGLDVLRDALRAAAGVAPASLAHGDLCEEGAPLAAARFSGRAGEAALRRTLAAWITARLDIDANLSAESAVERALLATSDLARGATAPQRHGATAPQRHGATAPERHGATAAGLVGAQAPAAKGRAAKGKAKSARSVR